MKTNLPEKETHLNLLLAEKIGYEQLLALLEQEWECLKRRDVAGLIHLTRTKENHLLEVKALRRQIQEGLASPGVNPKARDGVGLVDRRGELTAGGRKAAEIQRTIGRLKKEIQNRNERNRRYIEETLKIIEQFFSLLALPEEKAPVYMRYENDRWSTGARPFISRRL